MTLGTEVSIEIALEREGESSFTLGFRFRGATGEELARASVTHAAIDRATGRSVPLTEEMRQGLAALR
jgi:acyl-CoA thioesterase FadM